MGAGPASRHWRRYLRFSLRGLIVVVLVIGVGLGWIIRSARIQREAVAAIQNAGGIVIYDWEWSVGNAIPVGKPWAPRWLVDLVGVDFFGHVTAVWLYESSTATDATFAHVGRLAQLQQLGLVRSPVSDADLVCLRGLTKLTALNLNNTPVTDAGLAHVKGLTNLSELGLGGTQVTDIGLAHLRRLTKLNDVNLSYTHVSDAGLVHLRELTNLNRLRLTGAEVTDAGLVHLRGLTNLSFIDLDDLRVSVAGVKKLKHALPSLTISY